MTFSIETRTSFWASPPLAAPVDRSDGDPGPAVVVAGGVDAGAAVEAVGPGAAVEHVVASTAEETVGPVPESPDRPVAEEHVVAGTAEQHIAESGAVDGVGASRCIEDEIGGAEAAQGDVQEVYAFAVTEFAIAEGDDDVIAVLDHEGQEAAEVGDVKSG